MSTQVNTAFVRQFQDALYVLVQQRGSKLMGATRMKKTTGKSCEFDRIGPTSAVKRTTRHGDTPLIDTPHSRRRAPLDDYEWADLIDKQDEVRMLVDPKSTYAMNASNALGRTLDDVIIDAATGNATSVSSSDVESNVAITHTVDEDFNTANSDIILAKVIEARRILMANEVPIDEELYFVCDATSISTLLNDTTLTSADYNTVKPLAGGEIVSFMGFTFVQSERVNISSESFSQALAFSKEGIGLAMGQDISTRISERDDKGYSTQVYASLTAGAVRLDEGRVIVVEAFRS